MICWDIFEWHVAVVEEVFLCYEFVIHETLVKDVYKLEMERDCWQSGACYTYI